MSTPFQVLPTQDPEEPQISYHLLSSNSDTDGPPLRPASSNDAILADIVMTDPGSYINNHADNPRDIRTYRENNAAYSDGHVETHYKRFPEPVMSASPWDRYYIVDSWGVTCWLY